MNAQEVNYSVKTRLETYRQSDHPSCVDDVGMSYEANHGAIEAMGAWSSQFVQCDDAMSLGAGVYALSQGSS